MGTIGWGTKSPLSIVSVPVRVGMIGNDWERLGTIEMVGRYDLAQKSPGGTTWHDRTIGPTYSPSKRAQKK